MVAGEHATDPERLPSFEAEAFAGSLVGDREIEDVEFDRVVVDVQPPARQRLERVQLSSDIVCRVEAGALRHGLVHSVHGEPALRGRV